MADILKISTPLVDKVPVQANKQPIEANTPFDLSNISRVIKPGQQSEILRQNHGMIEREASPNTLMNLLKDPSVTVGFLRNIYMLQEIIKLLPINNTPLTQEIQQLFDALLIAPDEIVPEMMRQEYTSTAFKGELFDFLRELLERTPKPEMRYGVTNLLKSLNGMLSKQNILDSVSNSLLFLSENVNSSPALSEKLLFLAREFRQPDAAEAFRSLKQDALALLKELESSILFNPKMEKLLPLVTYNLSRFSDNPDFLRDATSNLLQLVDGGDQKQKLATLLYNYLTQEVGQTREQSHVIDVLARLLGRQVANFARFEGEHWEDQPADAFGARQAVARGLGLGSKEDEPLTLLNSDKIDKIVQSLLSSPCNYTPLLHFIIPVQTPELRSFAEIWIDPNDEEESGPPVQRGESIHMLIVFDVDGIGRFEADLYVRQKEISLTLLCPPIYRDAFAGIGTVLARTVSKGPFRLADVRVDQLERPRSLMEVFKNLPHKRTGIDVKI